MGTPGIDKCKHSGVLLHVEGGPKLPRLLGLRTFWILHVDVKVTNYAQLSIVSEQLYNEDC